MNLRHATRSKRKPGIPNEVNGVLKDASREGIVEIVPFL